MRPRVELELPIKQTRDSKTLQLILLVLITATVFGAQTYAIRFSTSAPVGQGFAVTASGSLHQEISSGISEKMSTPDNIWIGFSPLLVSDDL